MLSPTLKSSKNLLNWPKSHNHDQNLQNQTLSFLTDKNENLANSLVISKRELVARVTSKDKLPQLKQQREKSFAQKTQTIIINPPIIPRSVNSSQK